MLYRWLFAFALTLSLAACGGGGGGGGSDEPAVGGTTGGGTTGGGTTGGGTTGGGTTGGGTTDGGTTGGGTTGGGTTGGGTGGGTPPPTGEFGFTRTVFVDNSLSAACSNYDPDLRRCSGGGDEAVVSLAAATSQAAPGTAFQIREGNYREVLRLSRSGQDDAFVGFIAYNGETVTLPEVDSIDNGEDYGPIWLDGVRYNLVEGLTVRDSVGFLRAVDAHYNVIRNNNFDGSALFPSESKRGGLYFAWSTNNKIIDNQITRGTDSLALIRSDRNVVSGNTFNGAGHDIWVIKCGSYNIIRGNRFTNQDDKLGAVFDCEAATSSWHGNGAFATNEEIVDATHHNLIEENVFDTAIDWYSSSGGNGIQYAGQEGIVRRNVFVRTNVGLGMTLYPSEALYNYSNRVYHNVFHANFCGGIFVTGDTGEGRMEDNVYKNNVLWNNLGWTSDDSCAGDDSGQLLFRSSLAGHRFERNALASDLGSNVVRQEFGLGSTPDEFPQEMQGTLLSPPEFVNAAAGDYMLAATSPLIDQGDYLTRTRASGSGRFLEVEDALYFFDGFGIDGELGDRIQLEGSTETARIVEVDYDRGILTLDTDLTWDSGQGVAHAYAGSAPDLGVYER